MNQLVIEQDFINKQQASTRTISSSKKLLQTQTSVQVLLIRLIFLLATLLNSVSSLHVATPPPGSTCIQPADPTRQPDELRRADAHHDLLVQVSQNSVQFRSSSGSSSGSSSANKTDKSRLQVAFKSLCNGWRNSLDSDARQPHAYWALDPIRGALVAKFLFYRSDQFSDISSREAKLSSPVFPPIPAYHSMQDSRYFRTCKLTFSSYQTIESHLELTLNEIASKNNLINEAPASYELKKLMEGKNSRGKQIAVRRGEAAVWLEHKLDLPLNTSQFLPYYLEFSALSGPISSGVTQQLSYLNGVAISNFSLTPQCFGLEVDEEELERVKLLTGRDIRQFEPDLYPLNEQTIEHTDGLVKQILEKHKTSALLLLGVLIASVILISQYLFCAHLQRQRQRVYAKSQKQASDLLEEFSRINKDDCMRNHLHPLANVLEDVELNENPNYATQSALNSGAIWSSNARTSSNLRMAPYHIDRKRLTLTKLLGKGAFGEVYQGFLIIYCSDDYDDNNSTTAAQTEPEDQLESHSIKVAVKTLTDERMSARDFMKEAENMSLVSHRNIVELVGVCFDEPLYIVMELLPGGNLKNFLLKNRDKGYYHTSNNQLAASTALLDSERMRLCMGDLLVFALDIARACDYLQKKQFIHRDLAARNILLTSSIKQTQNAWLSNGAQLWRQQEAPCNGQEVDLEKVYLDGYQNSAIVAKLADFGMTRDIYSTDYYRMGHKELPVRWMPPECLDGVATSKSDVWSYGVFLWELFSMGQLPYQNLLDNQQVIEFIKARRHAKLRRPISVQNEEMLLTISDTDEPTMRRPLLNQSNQTNLMPLDADANELAEQPPLPSPHEQTPNQVYAIMCDCWATNPQDRPQFEEIGQRLYWCLQRPEVLGATLPCFYEQSNSGKRSPVNAQLNWWCQ